MVFVPLYKLDKLETTPLRVVVSYAYLVFSPTSRVFTFGYVNTETILHFFIKKHRMMYNQCSTKFLNI